MLKSTPNSKRILNQSFSNMESNLNHKCYFHGSYNITQFCVNKKCTLPLCEKCIPIHIKQHAKQQKSLGKHNIILFEEAHRIAVKDLGELVQKKYSTVQEFQSLVQKVKKQIEQAIEKGFNEIQSKVSERQNQIRILQEKHNKIKKGSLKTLIFYFADEDKSSFKSPPIQNLKDLISKIPQVLENLYQNVEKFEIEKNKPIKSNRDRFQFKDLLKPQVPKVIMQKKEKQQQTKSLKLQTSSDFDALLKDQRSRLENVRNKNIFFATGFDSANQENAFHKYGSKSVDNFYSSKETQKTKEQKQNRPLQLAFRNTANNFSTKKLTFDETTKNQEKIDQIRRKYTGDRSLSKDKSKNITSKNVQFENVQSTIQVSKGENVYCETKREGPVMRNNKLSDRILSREQIRLNIESRINQRSLNPMKLKEIVTASTGNLLTQYNQTFRKQSQRPTTESTMSVKLKNQQFTLNKNYHLNQTQNNLDENQKFLMSSIKKESIPVPAPGLQQQTRLKLFFQADNPQSLNKFDMKNPETLKPEKFITTKQQLNKISVDKQVSCHAAKGQLNHQSSLGYLSKKKEELYEQTKQRIRLSDPNVLKRDEEQRPKEEAKQSSFIDDLRPNTQPRGKQTKRFNYLYEGVFKSETDKL